MSHFLGEFLRVGKWGRDHPWWRLVVFAAVAVVAAGFLILTGTTLYRWHAKREFFHAVYLRDVNRARQWLQTMPSLARAANRRDETALHEACYVGDKEMVRLLIDSGADVNYDSRHLGLPLCVAVLYAHDPAIAEMLLQAGADVNRAPVRSIAFAATPLDLAVAHRRVAMTQILLEAGANPNSYGRNCDLPLYGPIEDCVSRPEDLERHVEIASLLVAHGARVDVRDEDHQLTPLQLAQKLEADGVDLGQIPRVLREAQRTQSQPTDGTH